MNTRILTRRGGLARNPRNSSLFRAALRLLIVFTALGWPASPVHAQTKWFSATVDPTSVSAGESDDYTFTITNCDGIVCSPETTGNPAIKTITVDIPAGFTLVPGSCSISAAAGDVWDLTYLPGQVYIDKEGSASLLKGESLTLTCTAFAPCEAGFYEWTTAAYNDDVEPPGPGTTPYTLVDPQPEVEVTGTCDGGDDFEDGDYCTYTQGGWGAPPNGGNPGQTLADNFDFVYPGDLVVGIGNDMTFWAASNVQAYLPAGGPPGALASSLVNPTSSSAGVFGGQVTTLKLNVDLNDAGVIDGFEGTISGLVLVNTGTSLDGLTIASILAVAETALGGGGLPVDYTIGDLNDLVALLNEAFDECLVEDWANDHLTAGPP